MSIPVLVFSERDRDISTIRERVDLVPSQFELYLALYKAEGDLSTAIDSPLNTFLQESDESRRTFQIRVVEFFFEKHAFGMIALDSKLVPKIFGRVDSFELFLKDAERDSRIGFVCFSSDTTVPADQVLESSFFPDLSCFTSFRRVWDSFLNASTDLRLVQNLGFPFGNLGQRDVNLKLFKVNDSEDLFVEWALYCIHAHQITVKLAYDWTKHDLRLGAGVLLPDLSNDLRRARIAFPDDLGSLVLQEFENSHTDKLHSTNQESKVIWMLKKIYRAIKRRLVAEAPIQISDPYFGIKVGENTVIGPCRRVVGAKYMKVGSNCVVGANCWFGAYDSYLFSKQTFNPSIEIGDNVFIGDNAIITSVNKIIIEEGVEISHDVYISDHVHSNTPEEGVPITRRRLVSRGYVKIGAYTGVGLRSVISQGVTLGKYCFVTPNSVVTRSFPDYSMIRGNPAILIKVFSKEKNKWEDPDPEMIKKYNRV